MHVPKSPPEAGPPGPAFARILELKRTLAGYETRFECQVLARDATHLVVLFIAPESRHVHGVELPAGTVTFGHFWRDRPYNVYHWLRPADGGSIGVYANLCDETRLDTETLSWRDLVVDVLALPGTPPVVLDEDELPADAPAPLRQRIATALATLLADVPALLGELEATRETLWPAVADRLGRHPSP